MAWIYSAASAESPWPWIPGCDQSPIAKTTDTLSLFCYHEWQRGICHRRPSGMTCGHSGATNVVGCELISLPEDSHAKISALQGLAKAWRASEADWFSRYSGSLKKSGQLSFFSKTSQPLGHVEVNEWGKNWPRSGMIVDGIVYPLSTWERRTNESVGGCLPTPTATPYGSNQGGASGRIGKKRYSLEQLWKLGRLPTPTVSQKSYDRQKDGSISHSLPAIWKATTGTTMPYTFSEWIMGYPLRWTAIEHWAMQWFRPKRGKCSRG